MVYHGADGDKTIITQGGAGQNHRIGGNANIPPQHHRTGQIAGVARPPLEAEVDVAARRVDKRGVVVCYRQNSRSTGEPAVIADLDAAVAQNVTTRGHMDAPANVDFPLGPRKTLIRQPAYLGLVVGGRPRAKDTVKVDVRTIANTDVLRTEEADAGVDENTFAEVP